jgi:GT2 family glycosyltransferase
VGVEGQVLSDKLNDPSYRAVTNLGVEGLGFMTANLFLRRQTFAAINGFDERFDNPHFREDTDLAWRALEHGSIPFDSDVRVYHPPHRRDVERERRAERNLFFEKDALLFQKHPRKYRELLVKERHFERTEGFSENVLRGAAKYDVRLGPKIRWLLESREMRAALAETPADVVGTGTHRPSERIGRS